MRNETTKSLAETCREEQLQLSWNAVSSNADLKATDGRTVAVLSPGTWNLEAGPDFKRAKIAFDGEEPVIGDIEVHRKTSDWISHLHWRDSEYDDVILHVVAEDDSGSVSEENRPKLPKAPTLILRPRTSRKKAPPASKFPPGSCGKFFSAIDDSEITEFLIKAGLKRLESKTEVFMEEMEERGVANVFLKHFFEACGYKRNSANFAELFDRVAKYDETSPDDLTALIWGESGLMPDPSTLELDSKMEEFTVGIWRAWWKIRMEPSTPIPWRRSGGRPLNSPERRVAALTTALARFGENPILFFAKLAASSNSPKEFNKKSIDSLVVSDPLWNGRVNFTAKLATPASVLGKSRAADIHLNVVLPTLAAYAKLAEQGRDAAADSGDVSLKRLVTEAFLAMPSLQTNRVIETATMRWLTPPSRKKNVITSAAAQQGGIHLHKAFCEPLCRECSACPVASCLKHSK